MARPNRPSSILFADSTETGGANFVAPEELIATFDMDGTLWVEKPMPAQAIIASIESVCSQKRSRR